MNPGESIPQIIRRIRHGGTLRLVAAVYYRINPARPVLALAAKAMAQGKTGLEIGGPSRAFTRREILPIYPCASRIDNVNFTNQTAWESGLREGPYFNFDPAKPPGRQYLREATALSDIADASYDFILSSHCLEHVANPLAALREWARVTHEGGHLLLILPDPSRTFDHFRPITPISHLREDFDRQTDESDLTHLPEILALHDLTRDPGGGSAAEFHSRGLRNSENRCLHHHVFDLKLMREMLHETGWEVLEAEQVRPMHLVALAHKRATPKERAVPPS